MPEGVIVGGWGYVIAAYTVTAAALITYSWSLVSRLRATHGEDPHHDR